MLRSILESMYWEPLGYSVRLRRRTRYQLDARYKIDIRKKNLLGRMEWGMDMERKLDTTLESVGLKWLNAQIVRLVFQDSVAWNKRLKLLSKL